jgi:hypothetical protein
MQTRGWRAVRQCGGCELPNGSYGIGVMMQPAAAGSATIKG